MANLEYADFDNSLFNEIEAGEFAERDAANDKGHLQRIAHEHRVRNPWRNHVNFADLLDKRLKALCKEGRIYHDGKTWKTLPAQGAC
jgi:hypothetical protein